MSDDGDDLLSPDEIEALLSAAGAGAEAAPTPPTAGESPSAAPPAPPSPAQPASTPVPPSAANTPASGGVSPRPSVPGSPPPSLGPEDLLDQAEQDLRRAVSPILNPEGIPGDLGEPAAYQFSQFDAGGLAGSGTGIGLKGLGEVELDLRIELGRTELLLEEVMRLREGAVVPLDKLAGDPVDILVNGKLIARGEVLVLNDNFCVRVAEILTPAA
ncbi:flagellar motor switch protein FliN [Calycomorphotria hydatis]|uniref:Flagellar motor switch protein FliN n=1 Tax=Calycomorphotria hydatis TaxID=2528027 RepID=A0A517TB86_9PLAN|nr:flagellar motor switch protein FliN [Calycomorphotria hydatis]QDT65638.1 Flagellar motor switch protein FliN [Calycomorphotria hydatis]